MLSTSVTGRMVVSRCVVLSLKRLRSSSSIVQVLRGSHLIGRIDHKRVGGQTGADMERVEHIKKVFVLHLLLLNVIHKQGGRLISAGTHFCDFTLIR